MIVEDLIDIIEINAPLSAAAPWDASGVQVAALRRDISGVAVMLDPCLAALERAAEAGLDFILAHHPLAMKPCFPNQAGTYLSVLSLLFTRNIWLYSAHTSLDANPDGPVRWLADALGLEALETLEPGAGGSPYGFGFVGNLPDAMPYEAFCRLLARAVGKREWNACGPERETVRRIACCPGSGNSLLPAALSSGADIFISGDIKHHTALDAMAEGLRVIDVGHFTLEEEMMRRFAMRLEEEIAVPVRFFPGSDPVRLERPAD